VKKHFSTPKIYNANGNLNKRWYVYFSYRNPKTGKLERMKNIYGKSNHFKTKEERPSILVVYRKKLLQLLKAGFNPFEENVDLFQERTKKLSPIKEENTLEKVEEPKMSLKEGLDRYYEDNDYCCFFVI